jgi:hypothetical protein
MRRLGRIFLALGAAALLARRFPLAREAYNKKVSSGSKPIEAVGTAVAAFVGLDVR